MTDWSTSASWIALIVAILSPMITARINARLQLELKKMELFAARKTDAFEAYLKAISALFSDPRNPAYFQEYLFSHGRAMLYLPPESVESVEMLRLAITKMRSQSLSSKQMEEIYLLWNQVAHDLAMQQFINEV